jgi:hypothetical protein
MADVIPVLATLQVKGGMLNKYAANETEMNDA